MIRLGPVAERLARSTLSLSCSSPVTRPSDTWSVCSCRRCGSRCRLVSRASRTCAFIRFTSIICAACGIGAADGMREMHSVHAYMQAINRRAGASREASYRYELDQLASGEDGRRILVELSLACRIEIRESIRRLGIAAKSLSWPPSVTLSSDD